MEIYDKKSLQKAFMQKKKLKFLFFWGHTPKNKDILDASCFSQWYFAPFTIENCLYPTAEHYMMREKALLFGQNALAEEILHSSSPAKAKELGRKVLHFDENTWQQHRFDIVFRGNLAKFSQNDHLRAYLLQTGKRILVEASPVDTIWGIGLDKYSSKAENPLLWQGENLLGFALMKVRDELQNK